MSRAICWERWDGLVDVLPQSPEGQAAFEAELSHTFTVMNRHPTRMNIRVHTGNCYSLFSREKPLMHSQVNIHKSHSSTLHLSAVWFTHSGCILEKAVWVLAGPEGERSSLITCQTFDRKYWDMVIIWHLSSSSFKQRLFWVQQNVMFDFPTGACVCDVPFPISSTCGVTTPVFEINLRLCNTNWCIFCKSMMPVFVIYMKNFLHKMSGSHFKGVVDADVCVCWDKYTLLHKWICRSTVTGSHQYSN